MRSDAQKRADKKYKAKIKGEKYHFCIEMSAKEAEMLRKSCENAGVTPHSIFLSAARDFIAAHALPVPGESGANPAQDPVPPADTQEQE